MQMHQYDNLNNEIISRSGVIPVVMSCWLHVNVNVSVLNQHLGRISRPPVNPPRYDEILTDQMQAALKGMGNEDEMKKADNVEAERRKNRLERETAIGLRDQKG